MARQPGQTPRQIAQGYVRDSGLLHALLGIATREQLLSHMVVGASWESHAIESLLSSAPQGVTAYFYRTSGGAEIDLLLAWPGGDLWAIEFKRSLSPKVERGFHSACEDLQPTRKWVVYPGQESYPLAADIQAVSLHGLCEVLRGTKADLERLGFLGEGKGKGN